MIISRDLSLRVVRGLNSITNFCIGDDITILTKENWVRKGILSEINENHIILKNDDIESIVLFDNIEKIEDTEWLGDTDIRDN